MENLNKPIADELHEIAPLLSRLKAEKAAFKKPPLEAAYFDKLTDDIFAATIFKPQTPAVQTQTARPSRLTEWLKALLLRSFAVPAAAFAVVLAVGFLLWSNNETPTTEYADLTADEIEAYVTANIDRFDSRLLSELLEDDVTLIAPELEAEDFDEALEDYLLEDYTFEN